MMENIVHAYNVSGVNDTWITTDILDSNSTDANVTVKPLATSSGQSWLNDMRFTSEVAIVLPLSILGIVGNIVSFIVLCRHKHRLSTTLMLQALAVTDAIILFLTILLRSLRYVHWADYNAVYHYVFVSLYPSLYVIRLFGSWLTVLLTFDRFIAVCYPLHAQRLCVLARTYINMFILLLVSILFSFVRFFEYEIVPPDVDRYQFRKTDIMQSAVYMVLYRTILFFLIMYLIPTTLMVVLNSRLLRTLKIATAYRATLQGSANTTRCDRNGLSTNHSPPHNGSQHANRVNRSITVIVTAVVLVAITCNLAAMVSHILYSLESCFDSLEYLSIYRRVASTISNILVTVNSAVNFIIYCVCSRNFRMVFISTFGCCSRTRRGNVSSRGDNNKRRSTTCSTTYVSLHRGSTRTGSPDKMI